MRQISQATVLKILWCMWWSYSTSVVVMCTDTVRVVSPQGKLTWLQVSLHKEFVLLLVPPAYHQVILWADEPQELLKPETIHVSIINMSANIFQINNSQEPPKPEPDQVIIMNMNMSADSTPNETSQTWTRPSHQKEHVSWQCPKLTIHRNLSNLNQTKSSEWTCQNNNSQEPLKPEPDQVTTMNMSADSAPD